MLAGLNRTWDEWLCDSFDEQIEEMELWKRDDAIGDFWSRLAKALQQSTWAEQLDSRLASVHTTGKLSWAYVSVDHDIIIIMQHIIAAHCRRSASSSLHRHCGIVIEEHCNGRVGWVCGYHHRRASWPDSLSGRLLRMNLVLTFLTSPKIHWNFERFTLQIPPFQGE